MNSESVQGLGCELDNLGLNIGKHKRCFSLQKHPDQLWDTCNLQGLFTMCIAAGA